MLTKDEIGALESWADGLLDLDEDVAAEWCGKMLKDSAALLALLKECVPWVRGTDSNYCDPDERDGLVLRASAVTGEA